MEYPVRTLREKKTDWMITWQDNPVRWVIFYYILGLIFSCVYTFVQEAVTPLPLRFLIKSLIVPLFIPLLTVFGSIVLARRRTSRPSAGAARKEADPS